MKPRFLFTAFLSLLTASTTLLAQEDLSITRKWAAFSDLPNSLYRYFQNEALQKIADRQKKIEQINGLHDWQLRQTWIQKTLPGLIGSFPRKTPLHPRVTATYKKGNYTLQNIVFESQPGFFVTAALYLPSKTKNKKMPAILYCSGHSTIGYREPAYQQAILNLVDKGFVVLAFDPVDQGERIEYPDSAGMASSGYEPDKEHSYSGAPLFVSGGSLCREMIWDGIRALDYLAARKEVDTARLGITGRSGGGTQSAFIAAVDPRVKVAVPEDYITNFARLIQSSGPQDAEQDLAGEIAAGFDLADLLTVRAPKPTMVISTTRDATFSIQGADETVKEVRRVYEAYRQTANFQYVTDDAPHASTKKDREAMYAFFQKWLNNPGDPTDKEQPVPSKAELQVTPTGQVASAYHGATIFSLHQQSLAAFDSATRGNNKGVQFIEAAKKLSGFRQPDSTDRPAFTGRYQRDGYAIEKYFIKGEGDYVVPFLLFRPKRGNDTAMLYLDANGKAANAQPGQEIEQWVKRGYTVLAPDVVGIGETGPGAFTGDSYINKVSYNIWYLSIMIGRSVLAVRTGDVVKLARLALQERWAKAVSGTGSDELVPVLIHAAAFDSIMSKIYLTDSTLSYRTLMQTRSYDSKWIFSLVAGSLMSYDLPDLLNTLRPGRLELIPKR